MIFDTNTLSALAARNPDLLARIKDTSRAAITLISLGEFTFGVEGSTRRDELQRWLAAFLARAEVLAPDLATVPFYAAIRRELKQAGTPIPANDVWIAALARQHQREILSQDRHFDLVAGVVRVGW